MFYKIINLIKINYNLKKNYIIAKLNKNDLNIIKIFVKFNIIKMVVKKKNSYNTYIIYFQYIKNEPIFKNITNVYKPSKPFFLNLKQINKINKKNNNIFLISTNKGLISNFEAENCKTGGILIFLLHI